MPRWATSRRFGLSNEWARVLPLPGYVFSVILLLFPLCRGLRRNLRRRVHGSTKVATKVATKGRSLPWALNKYPHKGRRGAGRGGPFLFGFPSPRPSPHSFLAGRGRRSEATMPLNSMAVGIKGEGPCFLHRLRKFL